MHFISIIITILHIQIQLDTKKSIRDCQEKRYFEVKYFGENMIRVCNV